MNNLPQRRAGETDALFPHLEVPFTAADREAILEIRDTLCDLRIFVENFDPSTLLAGLMSGNEGASPMGAILSALAK